MKRLGSFLLAAAMVLSLFAAPVSAEAATQANVTAKDTLCPCGCGLTVEAVQWKQWTVNDTGAPSSGHYYLPDNYVQKQQFTIMAGDRVVLDLRGKTLSTSGYSRLFLVHGYLAVLDTVGGGQMRSKTSGTAFGGVVIISKNETLDPTFALYSGTVTQDTDNKSSKDGGLICVGDGSWFKMYGGRLIGGTTKERGGAVYAGGKTTRVEITGGSIIGCSAEMSGGAIYSQGSVLLSGCTITGSKSGAGGGNIYMHGGNLTIKENTVIENGVTGSVEKGGGNLFAGSGCQLSVENSTIRNGYAATNGGNLCLEKGTQSLTNTTVSSGVVGNIGANLYCADTSATTTLNGCNISGDVFYGSGKLTIEGSTKIGLNNYGLKLASGVTFDASGLTSGAEVYVDGQQVSGEYLKAGSYCPHCDKAVTWSAMAATPSDHCYLTADTALAAGWEITADAVIDLRGFDITSSERVFNIAVGGSLTLLDSVGGGKVQGSGNAESAAGGVLYNAGNLSIRGGNYSYVADERIAVTSGGVVHSDGNLELHGGVFDGSAFHQTEAGSLGGALCTGGGSYRVTVTAGRFVGGSAYQGGSAYFGYDNTVNITGGSFVSGSAANAGGNLRFTGTNDNRKGTANISGIVLEDGTGNGGSGGNLSVGYYALTLENCLIDGGSSTAYGGNIALGNYANLTLTDCIINGGSAPMGGNVYSASYIADASLTDCLVTNGKATNDRGGNIMINHGFVVFAGGEISRGTAAKAGGNVYTNAGNYSADTRAEDDCFRLAANASGMAPLVVGGTAGTNGGNIYSIGDLELLAALIRNGTAAFGADLYYDKGDNGYSLTVGAGLTGDISLAVAPSLLGGGSFGQEISGATAVEFPGRLLLEGDYGQPALTVKDGKLYLGGIAVITADGSVQWFTNAEDAVDNCPEGGYVKLYTDSTLELTKDCYVDINGKQLRVSGGHTLYGMDSSGDSYSLPAGAVIWEDADAVKTLRSTDAPNGNRYVAIADDNVVTYHRLGMALTDVTLRTSACGIYYKATWNCDEALLPLVDCYGIVLSVYHMPGEDFATDSLCLPVQYDGANLMNNEKKTGVMIKNIMKETLSDASNSRRGQIPIYANAYLRLTDGTLIMTDRAGSADDVAYSLKAAMDRMDSLITSDPTHYRRYTGDIRAFYQKWQEKGMNDWNFVNYNAPVKDDVIDVLMIGSSFCYYYVEELYALAEAAGIKMRVCNVYYSGGKLEQHYNWWINNESNYQLFITDGNGRKQYNSVSLEYCLAQGNWDVISLQEAPSAIRAAGVEQHLATTATYTDALIPYLQEQFPDARFCWHQTWAYQIGYDRSGYKVTSFEQQERDMQMIRDFSLAICEKYNATRINTGEAWQIVRRDGYDDFCARLGIGDNNVGDYYHDGDIGGAQYLNACVWFEILTGKSCVGNAYEPVYTYQGKTYTLDADLITTLQNAAHQAVADLAA